MNADGDDNEHTYSTDVVCAQSEQSYTFLHTKLKINLLIFGVLKLTFDADTVVVDVAEELAFCAK